MDGAGGSRDAREFRPGEGAGPRQDRAADSRGGVGRDGIAAHRCHAGVARQAARARAHYTRERGLIRQGIVLLAMLEMSLRVPSRFTARTAKYQVPDVSPLTV